MAKPSVGTMSEDGYFPSNGCWEHARSLTCGKGGVNENMSEISSEGATIAYLFGVRQAIGWKEERGGADYVTVLSQLNRDLM